MTKTAVVFLIITLGNWSVNSWIINNIDVPQLKKHLDSDNELSDDEFAQHKFNLIYPGFIFLTNACGIINSVTARQIARSLSESTGNFLDFEEIADDAQMQLQIIPPGTKWCGAGSIADNYEDLGYERETDMCCRDHDNCPDMIGAGETKYNLTNEAFYTRLSCKCDEQFRKCLRNTKRGTANNIGTVYFNALATKCFKIDFPTLGCVKRGGWLNRKCLQYTYDITAKKLYQWFDVNNY